LRKLNGNLIGKEPKIIFVSTSNWKTNAYIHLFVTTN